MRVSEPGATTGAPKRTIDLSTPLTGQALSEEVAALLDAFSLPTAEEPPETESATVATTEAPRDAGLREPTADKEIASESAGEAARDAIALAAAGSASREADQQAEDSERILREALRPAALRAAAKASSIEDAFQDLLNLRIPKVRKPPVPAMAKVKEAPPPAPGPGQTLDLASLAEKAWKEGRPLPPPSPPASPAPQVAGAGYGPYCLLERVAVGGMAEVFKAKRSGVEGFEKTVAVKRILPHLSENKEFVDMFINEAKMVAGLTHPNIVQIFDLGRLEKTYYIAMEFIHGRDLRSILRRAKERGLRIPLDISCLVVSKVCLALEFAHRKKDERGRPMMIVHRDVSPQNILISFEGEVKLTDFGIAKAATKASMTDAGALRGKLLYMSPEQAWGKRMDRRSDVFSLGIVFYEMVTEEKPFLGGSEMSILEMVRECRVPPPSTVNPRIPEKLEKVIMKALERDPLHRYQDASEMSRDLERVLQERRAPAASELARFMEILFDEDERVDMYPGDVTPEEFRPAVAADLDVEFDQAPTTETKVEEPADVPQKNGKEAMSIQKLLKRFGIK